MSKLISVLRLIQLVESDLTSPYDIPDEEAAALYTRLKLKFELAESMPVPKRVQQRQDQMVAEYQNAHKHSLRVVVVTDNTMDGKVYVKLGKETYILKDCIEDPKWNRYVSAFRKLAVYKDHLAELREAMKKAKLAMIREINNTTLKVIDQTAKSTQQVNVTSIPQTIKIPNMSKRGYSEIDNPYYTNPHRQYAGTPEHADLHSTQRILLATMQDALRRNGIPLMTVMYLGYHNKQHSNFIAFNKDMSFVWRKYDVGSGSGQNYVFINGLKYAASTFSYNTKAKNNIMLAQIIKSGSTVP